ncbi:MAG TPA: ferredoxin--NADP(+) reductase [Chloroflexi bacterium]|nr:ferredoxin--NADP(+) reductase [Chloroflexota bacterium]
MATTDGKVYDVTILGAGPTGLFGAFYAGMREMKTKIIEALPEMGGQLTVLYPEKFIYDVPGYPKILSKDLVKRLVEQGTQWGAAICLDERITSLEYVDHGDPDQGHPPVIRLTAESGTVHLTHTVVICAGIGAFAPNKLDRPGVHEYEGRGVAYFVREKAPYRSKNVLIVGGGDSAVDWALNLKDWARQVTLIHRREGFRAHESSVAELMNSQVEVKVWWELEAVLGDGEHVTGARIFNNKTDEKLTLHVDHVIFSLGFKASLGPIADWGLKLAGRHILVDGLMRTNLPGVYAAGDIVEPVGSVSLNLIVTGFAQAAIAVNVAKSFLDPKSKIFPGHSSEMRI